MRDPRFRKTSRPIRRLAQVLLLFALPDAACAHTAWTDGRPVPAWVTTACCGPSDAHHLRPDQVRRVADGFQIDGYPKTIHDFEVLPSPDGEYWAFYSESADADGRPLFTSVFCFFAPSFG